LKERFAHSVAKVLDDGRQKKLYDRLVLVAPPKTLGYLRDELSKPTRDTVHGELAKDLTHHEMSDVEKHLGELMAI